MNKKSSHIFFGKFRVSALLVLLLILSFSCRKDKVLKLPPITTEGRNTFGAYVDGELWLPSDGVEFGIRPICVSYGTDSTFIISETHDMASTGTSAGGGLTIAFKGINSTGSYDLTDINKSTVSVTVDGIDSPIATFLVLKGTLNIIKFDRADNIISGTFNFKIKNKETGRTHEATDGRFDVNFDYCK